MHIRSLRPSVLSRIHRPSPILLHPRNVLAFSSSASKSTSTTTPAATNPPTAQTPTLDWATFFRLRLIRRRFNVGGSVITSLGAMAGTAQFIASEPTVMGFSVMTLDPMVLGLITFAGGALGWVLGPAVGTPVFGLFYKGKGGALAAELAKKDKILYERIKKYRVNPSAQSVVNPVPDYYGEKISSVSGYRQWLKDQRAYNKKAGFSM